MGFLILKLLFPFSYFWWSESCYLLLLFKCCIWLHIMVKISCLIDSFCQLVCPFMAWCNIAILLHLLVCVLVGFVLSSVCIYILIYWLHWTLLTSILCGIVVWFFAVGLLCCRCLVDLPGVKTLLLTNQQHQLPKELVYHLRHLKIQMRKDSDFRLIHMPTQMCLTSQLL